MRKGTRRYYVCWVSRSLSLSLLYSCTNRRHDYDPCSSFGGVSASDYITSGLSASRETTTRTVRTSTSISSTTVIQHNTHLLPSRMVHPLVHLQPALRSAPLLLHALRRTIITPAPPSATPTSSPSTSSPSPTSASPSPVDPQAAHELLIESTSPHFSSSPPNEASAGETSPILAHPPSSTHFAHIPSLPPLPTPPHGPTANKPSARPPHPHPFDTHAIVKHLENAGFEHGEARQVMRATRELVLRRTELARQELLGKEDMENVNSLTLFSVVELV